jgi:hypothetical protein
VTAYALVIVLLPFLVESAKSMSFLTPFSNFLVFSYTQYFILPLSNFPFFLFDTPAKYRCTDDSDCPTNTYYRHPLVWQCLDGFCELKVIHFNFM